MNKTLRISLFGLVGAVGGFTLQGCFAPQPLPECNVTVSSSGFGLNPYYVKLDNAVGTGACAMHDHMWTGMQRYRSAPIGGEFTLAVKSSIIVDPAIGDVYSADQDPSNNCVNEEDCQGADDPTMACVVAVADGGVELGDGTPVDPASGDVALADGGTYAVDLANECVSVEEPLPRTDAADPEGKNIPNFGKLPTLPTNGVCAITEWTAGSGVQNFQAEDLTLADGSMQTVPAAKYAVEWTDFKLISTPKVPGTAFTGKVKITEAGCEATYDALGIWPPIECATDVDCDPNADLDAGRATGSGISPDWKPTCDTARGICVPSVDVTKL